MPRNPPGGGEIVTRCMSPCDRLGLPNRFHKARRPIEVGHPLKTGRQPLQHVGIRADDARKAMPACKARGSPVRQPPDILRVVHFHQIDEIENLIHRATHAAIQQARERVRDRNQSTLLANVLRGLPYGLTGMDVLAQKQPDQVPVLRCNFFADESREAGCPEPHARLPARPQGCRDR